MDQLADFEPLEYYEKHLKGAIERNAEEYFDALVKRSGVDPEQNKATVARYNKEAAEAEEAGKKLGSFKALKIFLIVLTVIAFLAAVILIFSYASGEGYWLYLFLGILFALLGIGLVVLLCTVIKKKLKEREERTARRQTARSSLPQVRLRARRGRERFHRLSPFGHGGREPLPL